MNMNRRNFLTGSAALGLMTTSSLTLSLGETLAVGGGDSINSLPSWDGFRMPGEFEPHEAIWLVWPEQPEWRLSGREAEKVYLQLVEAIADDIQVRLAVTAKHIERVRSLVPTKVNLIEMDAGSGWVRDDGPTFLIDDVGRRRGVDWVFNSWGFPEEGYDNSDAAEKILEKENAARYKAPLVLEGGSIHSDGQGTILTTAECLLNENRNPNLYQSEIEQHLMDYLGARKIIWLPKGVFEDSTSGHVDNMCCFVRPSEVMLTWTDDQSDEQYERSRKALDVLESTTDANGNPFKVHKLIQPGPLFMSDTERSTMPGAREGETEDRLAGSYVNYIVTNRKIIFPLLDKKTDSLAYQTFAEAYPEREIVGVPGREILLHGGNFHCISQNLPSL